MISLTPAAAQQLHAAIDDADAQDDGLALRLAARVGDDGEIEFGMGFDEQREGDLAFDDKGVNMLVGAPSRELLQDTVLDFVEVAPGNFGFVLRPDETEAPPPAAGTCGSGGCSKCGGGGV